MNFAIASRAQDFDDCTLVRSGTLKKHMKSEKFEKYIMKTSLCHVPLTSMKSTRTSRDGTHPHAHPHRFSELFRVVLR